MVNKTLTALHGVNVGHATHLDKLQGVTVVTFDTPYPVAYKANGGTSRLYDNQILNDGKSYPLKYAIFISDGSLKGLETAVEVIRALREKGIGWRIEKSVIPSITGATVQSLGMKLSDFDTSYGYEAAHNVSKEPVKGGNIGAGTGVSVGKFSWTKDGKCLAMKTGLGSARINLPNNVMVCALTVVNALGNVIGADGQILAGNRDEEKAKKFRTFEGFSDFLSAQSNTTISIVGTNAKISTQEDLRKIAEIATHGQVRAINPVNTSLDGDSVFVFSTQQIDMKLSPVGEEISKSEWYKIGIDILGQTCAQAVQNSIYNACEEAETIQFDIGYKGIIPSIKDYP